MQAFASITAILEYKALNNELWRWGGLLGLLIASLGLGKLLSLILRRQADRLQRRQRLPLIVIILRSLSGPATLLLLAGALHIARSFLDLTIPKPDGETSDFIGNTWLTVTQTITVIAIAWILFRLVEILERVLEDLTARTETTLDDQLVPILRKAIRIFVVILAVLFILQNALHQNIGTLLAGLGLGGLAFALAAKDMVSNFFGSVTIFADRPFHLGERVKIAGHDGMVEEVGFRSTRIRTLDGNLVTIPNATVANETIENVARRPFIKRVLDVTVTYDTPAAKLHRAVEIIREILDQRKQHFHSDCPPRVYFNDFNAASLNIVVYYYFAPPDWWEYLEFTHEFNMELLRRFNEEGIEFAFPTQTLYLKKELPAAEDRQADPPAIR